MRLTNKNITVLDIHDKYVKCAQIRHSAGKWHVWKKKEISSADEDKTSYIIKSLLQEMDIYPPKNVITHISGRDASIKLLDLPPMSDKRFEDAEGVIRYELMMHLPMNIEQMYYDYQVVESDNQKTRILTAVVKRSVLNKYMRLLSSTGVYPDVVTISSFALFNAFVMKEPDSIGSGTIGLICLRNSNGDIVITEDGHLTYARSFSLLQAFEKGLSERGTRDEAPREDKEHLIREISNSFDTYFRSQVSGDERREKGSLDVVHLVTEDGQLPLGLTESDLSRISPGSQWRMHTEGDDLVLGMAFACLRSAPRLVPLPTIKINLSRQIIQERRIAERKAMKARLGKVAPAIIAIVLLMIAGTLWWQIGKAKEKLHFLEDTLQSNEKRIALTSTLNDLRKKLEKQIESLDWVADDYPMVSYRLYRIAKVIPDNLWLKEVYIPEVKQRKKQEEHNPISKLYVVGYAQEQSQIENFLDNLRRCDCFSDVKQENTSEVLLMGERILEFQIGLTSDSGQQPVISSQGFMNR